MQTLALGYQNYLGKFMVVRAKPRLRIAPLHGNRETILMKPLFGLERAKHDILLFLGKKHLAL
jgi:hypothetical protein